MSWELYDEVVTGTPDVATGKSLSSAIVPVYDDADIEVNQYIPHQLLRVSNRKREDGTAFQSVLIGDFTTVETHTNLYDIFNSAATGELGFVFFGHVSGISVTAYYAADTPSASFAADFVLFSNPESLSEYFTLNSLPPSIAVHPFEELNLQMDAILDIQRLTFAQDAGKNYYQNGANPAYYFSERKSISFSNFAPSGMVIIPRVVPTSNNVKIGVTVENADGFIFNDMLVSIGNTPNFLMG